MHPILREDLLAIAAAPLDWERFAGKTILVTGGAGFLASQMVETLLLLNETKFLGCHVICLVRDRERALRRFAHHPTRSDLSYVIGDAALAFEIPCRCDFIIHAASHASPRFYGIDPVGVMNANLKGTSRLLDLAHKWQSEGLLLFSSGEVYGQVPSDKVPTSENDYGYINILNPRSCYAESKRAAETLAVCHAAQFGTRAVIVRPFHTYGPGISLDDGRVFADFVRDAVNGKNISLHGDGKAIRAFCYTRDAISGFFTAFLKGETAQAYNVGNPNAAISIEDLAELVASSVPELSLSVDRQGKQALGYIPSPIQINSPDIGKISALGWTPSVLPAEGFHRTICYFTENR